MFTVGRSEALLTTAAAPFETLASYCLERIRASETWLQEASN